MGCFGYICPKCETQIVGDYSGGGEECILIHVREGKELGRTVGHYAEYGNVFEDKKFREDTRGSKDEDKENMNSHSSICDSEMHLDSSMNFGGLRDLPNGQAINIREWYNVEELKIAFVEFGNYPNLPPNALNLVKAIPRTMEVDMLEFSIEMAQEILDKGSDKEREAEIKDSLAKDTKRLNEYKANPMIDLVNTEDFKREMNRWAQTLPISKKATSGIIAYHKVCYDGLKSKKISDLKLSLHDPDQSWGNPRSKYGGTPHDWDDDEEED